MRMKRIDLRSGGGGSRAACFGGCLIGALLLAFAPAAAASDDADREKLMDAAKRELESVERELARVASDKSDRNVEKVFDGLDDVEDEIKDLNRIAEGSEEAEEFVETYTDNLKKLARPLRALQEMEDIQLSIDRLPDTCESATEKLEDQVEALVRVPEEEDEEAIERLTAKTGEAIEGTLEKADRLESDLKRKNSEVGRASFSEADWRDVGRALDRAGDDVLRYYERSLDSAHRACDDLAEPEELDFVTAALALVRSSYNAAEKFLEDGEAWFDRTREIFPINCDGLDDVRVAYCSVDFGPNDDGERNAKINAWGVIIARAKAVRAKLDPVLEEYRDLKKTGDYIKGTTGNNEVTRLLTNMGKRYQGLLKVRDGSLLKGSRNPWLQTWQKYGVTQHTAMTSSNGCDVADIRIPGSNKRPDCFIADDCMILEFKPDSSGAKREGLVQLRKYKALLEAYFEDLLEDASEADDWAVPSSSYGGSNVLKTLIDNGCVSDDRTEVGLATDLETYDRCDRIVATCPEP